MKQQLFEERYSSKWLEYETILKDLKSADKSKPLLHNDFPGRYRQICNYYALAKSRRYSPQLVQRLHDLVMESHQYFYRANTIYSWQFIRFFLVDFPQAMRKQARLFWLSTALMVLPGILLGSLCYQDENFIYTVAPANMVVEMETMYDPKNKIIGRARESSTNFMMFGFYIYNNVGIGFRTFAGGLLLGLGAILSLVFNGVFIGAVAGHLTQAGFTSTFWPFVSGHSAFELTAICITGAAGLRLAVGIFAPGQFRRGEALKIAGREAIPLALGAASMLFVAAIIEAFWSSNASIPVSVKYGVAAVFWSIVVSYFTFLGRHHANH